MTSTIALIGKSGSGKTTLVRAFFKLIKKNFPNSSILLIDNDLTLELSDSFGIITKNTIYGIKAGKHEYRTGIPKGMLKQEYIDWALEDIIVEVDDNVDLISAGFVTPKDCMCLSSKLTRDCVSRLVESYDFAIFDCEYDLKYLNCLIDNIIDETIIVSTTNKQDIVLASKIVDLSRKYALDGQLGLILNKVKKENLNDATNLVNDLELNLIGCIEEFDNTDEILNPLESMYTRLNLPQVER